MAAPNKQIKRDYNRPFFSQRKRGLGTWLIFAIGFGLGAILIFTYINFDRVQLAALDAIGIAPTATPFASDYALKGANLYASGNVQEAALQYKTATELQPDNINYLYEYGQSLIDLVDLDILDAKGLTQAAELGDRIIAIDPDDPRGYALKSRTMMWNNPNVAIPIALNGLDQDEKFAPLHAVLAVAYTNIGRYAEGLARGAQAVALDPMDAKSHRAYSIPLIYTGRYDTAIDQLEEAVTINPNLTAPYFELAAQYRRVDYPEMAVSIYWRVLEIDPTNARAYLRLCETYASVGKFRDAQTFCESALDLAPDYADAYRELGRMQYNRRNYEGAIDSFNTCVSLGSEDVSCYYLRGLAHYFLGQCDQAWEVLQQSLQYTQEESIISNIYIGLDNVTVKCAGYQNQVLPTEIPPTPIPPTPIGGGF